MNRTIVSLAALAIAMPALAQTTAPQPNQNPQTRPPVTATPANPATPGQPAAAVQRAGEADTARLIGRNVKNSADETIGEITSVIISRDGTVTAVIVGVGGFLGIGQREVAIRWQDLQIMNNGEIVRANLTRQQLEQLPEYRYAENQRRGTVYAPTPMPNAPTAQAPATQAPTATAPATPGTAMTPTAPNAPMTGTASAPGTPAPNAMMGSLSANELIGATVRGPNNQAIGRVYDLVVDGTGALRSLVVSTGGVLGVGGRRTELPFAQVRITHEREAIVVSTAMTEEMLARNPEYRPIR